MAVGNTFLHDVCSELNFGEVTTVTRLIDVLDENSKVLATDEEFRARMGEEEPSVWPDLRRLWATITAAHSGLTSEDEDSGQEATLRNLCISLARFTRNLVAAVPYNQERAFENEPDIRELIRYYTSYLVLQDPKSLSATRMLAQTLCNLVTANEALMERLWDSYLGLPEEQLVLTRLLSVPDPVTTTATFVLILNCLHGSDYRTSRLASTSSGSRLCISLLDRMVALFDGPEPPDESGAFSIGYNIFRKIVEADAAPAAYARIAVDGEVVSPHQTTFLKLLDSYLQPSPSRPLTPDSGILRGLCEFLSGVFFALSTYTQLAISRTLGPHNTRRQPPVRQPDDVPQSSDESAEGSKDSADAGGLQELDLLLPKVCEALVLVTQCLTSLCLISEESANTSPALPPTQKNSLDDMRAGGHLKDIVSGAVSPTGEGLVENLIEALRQLDLFLPRITLGTVAPTAVPVSKAQESARKLHEEAHAQGAASVARSSDPKGFSYLKRDLVRLLGILSSDRKTVQDRVHACGGIQVVMNLCTVDERNPYLREHAIFALRNLLHGNNENQMLVNDIQPMAEWDDNGILQR